MKIRTCNKKAGSTLMLVLFLTGLMGFSLAAYLMLVRYQNMSIMRSVSWNSCIPISEAGVEEAMTHINRSTITNLLQAGWTLANGSYTKSRYLGDSYYNVFISTADPPVIISEGYVLLPLAEAPTTVLGAVGVDGTTLQRYNRRKVRVTTIKDGMWTKAMVAKDTIDLNGWNVTTDSFDSSDPNYSTDKKWDILKRKDNGDVATNSRIINSLDTGNAKIYGSASTGPGGSVAIGTQGVIGDLAWHKTNFGIQPNHTNDDMNVQFGIVRRPFNGGFTPTGGTLGETSYKYLLGGGEFSMAELSLTGQEVMLVTNHVKLLVTGNIDIKGNAYIDIAPNSSLELYMDGPSANIAGNGIVNRNSTALSFVYFGTPDHRSLSITGNGTFTGAIYAPEADFVLGGGGSNTNGGVDDFSGASVSKTVRMLGKFRFHYDESLGRSGWARGYLVAGWDEI
jgi:hypothetical protein